jgi:hypothetical protein
MPVVRFEALAPVKLEGARILARYLQADGGETSRAAPFRAAQEHYFFPVTTITELTEQGAALRDGSFPPA